MKGNKYRFTIITATYNCGQSFIKTAQSIKYQDYKGVQWIVCDGGSSRATLKLINSFSELIDVFISERDDGIYYAWNKAIKYIKGDWVLFIGAGDVLYSPKTLLTCEREISKFENSTKIIYGKIQLVTNDNETLKVIGQPWDKIKNKWQHGRKKLPVHPEVFHHKSLFEVLQFDTRFKIVGDSDFLIKAINISNPIFINTIVTKMVIGGVSQQPRHILLLLKEIKLLNRIHGLQPPVLNNLLFHIRLLLKLFFEIVLGEQGYLKLRTIIKR